MRIENDIVKFVCDFFFSVQRKVLIFLLTVSVAVISSTSLAQKAADYYPLDVGNYWIWQEKTTGEYSRVTKTTTEKIEGTDILRGQEYFRVKVSRESEENPYENLFTEYRWLNEFSGEVKIYAMSGESDIESAKIFDDTQGFSALFLPSEDINPGTSPGEDARPNTVYVSTESMNETVSVPAGTFYDCVVVKMVSTDKNAEIAHVTLTYFAKDIGVILETHGNLKNINRRIELSEYSVQTPATANEQAELPGYFHLKQNYPNPFNPETTIEFILTHEAAVNLVVYDIMGQKIRTLVSESASAGTHKIRWEGKNDLGQAVSSGVYLIRLRVGSRTMTHRMMLLR